MTFIYNWKQCGSEIFDQTSRIRTFEYYISASAYLKHLEAEETKLKSSHYKHVSNLVRNYEHNSEREPDPCQNYDTIKSSYEKIMRSKALKAYLIDNFPYIPSLYFYTLVKYISDHMPKDEPDYNFKYWVQASIEAMEAELC